MNSMRLPSKGILTNRLLVKDQSEQHGKSNGFVCSAIQTPQSGSTFWSLKSPINVKEKIRSGEKSLPKTKLSRAASHSQKNQYGLNSQHNGMAKPLERVSNINLESAMYLIQAAIKECSLIHHRAGSSYFPIRNCFLNPDGKLIIHFSTVFSQAALANSDETVVVRDIIQAIHKICLPKCFDDFYLYYKRTSVRSKCDFKYTLSLIQSYCKCSKIVISDKVNEKQVKNNFVRQITFQLKAYAQSAQKTQTYREMSQHPKRMSYAKVSRQSLTKRFRDKSQTKLCKQKQMKKKVNFFTNSSSSPKYSEVSGDKSILNTKQSSKQSTISTNLKKSSSFFHGDSLDTSASALGNKLVVGNLKTDSLLIGKPTQNRQYLCLPADLDEVQSLGESSELEQDSSRFPSRRFETPRDAHQQFIRKQNQQRILSINNWTRKFQGLLSQQRDLKQSFTQKFHHQSENNPTQIYTMMRRPPQCTVPVPSEFHHY